MIEPRYVDKPLVLYGKGKLGDLAAEIFAELNIPIAARIDHNIQTILPSEHYLLAVCVATEPYGGIVAKLGWKDVAPVWDILEAYSDKTGIHNGWMAGQLSPEDRAGISAVSLGFMDKLSITHYFAFVDWRKYHDELDYVAEPREALPSTLADIRKRQHKQKYMLGGFSDVSIHNEGYELQTIQDSIEVLRKDRPRIETACYHSRDGLWLIEKFLMDSLPDYLWTFRMSAFMGQGAYIYGIPKEKTI